MADNDNTATRRAVLGAAAFAAVAPIALGATVALAKDDADRLILAAWNDRQKALAAIEARGAFFTAEEHSPAQCFLFDMAEMAVHQHPAKTPRGVLCKLWVALSHVGTVHTEEQRAQHDAIR